MVERFYGEGSFRGPNGNSFTDEGIVLGDVGLRRATSSAARRRSPVVWTEVNPKASFTVSPQRFCVPGDCVLLRVRLKAYCLPGAV